MAAAQEPQPNPYELHPQPTIRAEPGHVHRFVASGYTQRCIYCHVEETWALRADIAERDVRDQIKDAAILEAYREATSKYTTIKKIIEKLSYCIALSQWPDEQRNDDDR